MQVFKKAPNSWDQDAKSLPVIAVRQAISNCGFFVLNY